MSDTPTARAGFTQYSQKNVVAEVARLWKTEADGFSSQDARTVRASCQRPSGAVDSLPLADAGCGTAVHGFPERAASVAVTQFIGISDRALCIAATWLYSPDCLLLDRGC